MKRIYRLFRQRLGTTVTEYAIIVSIISISGIVLLAKIGDSARNLLEQTNNNMPR
jgi:Flp pilus assembly pilin Flp